MAKKNRKVIVYTAIAAIVLIGGLSGYLILRPPNPPPYATYFTYTSDELDSLRELSSDKRVSIDDLFAWEDMLFDRWCSKPFGAMHCVGLRASLHLRRGLKSRSESRASPAWP